MREATYSYVDDEGHPVVTFHGGGTVIRTETRDNGIIVNHIRLTRPLEMGETASLRYMTEFGYEKPPELAMRRAVPTGCSLVEVTVRFDRGRLPKRVFRAEWDTQDGPPTVTQHVHLDAEHAVSSLWQDTRAPFVGFTWTWDDPGV